ncbi:MAG TPA: aldo/keto reductase [Actinomycetota bacterium]|nr:aldo/keto reductase [Actinomycetota bacterium]
MQLREVGPFEVFPIGMGCAALSVAPGDEDGEDVILAGLEAGATLLDTAACYVPGHLEQGHNELMIAAAVKRFGKDASNVVVATKGGVERTKSGGTIASDFIANGSPEFIKFQCDRSLGALGPLPIGIYQLHSPDPKVPVADTMSAFKELKDEGKIQGAGLCNVTVKQIKEASQVVRIDSVQNRFNPADRNSADVIDYCEQNHITFLAYSPLGGLGEKARQLGANNPRFEEVAQSKGVSPQRIALAWELALSTSIIPIPGSRRRATIKDSLAAATVPLSEEEVAFLNG